MLSQRVAAMFDELRDQVVAMVQEHEQQGSQMTELQGQLAAQTQRVEALEAELQGLRQLLVQDAEESETETRTPPSSPNTVDSPTSVSDEEMEPSRLAIANSLLKHLYARLGAKETKEKGEVGEVEAKEPQVPKEVPEDGYGPKPTHWRCVWRPGMDIRSERNVQRKGVVGFLSCGEVFDVIEEWPGIYGTVFLKLAGDKGWVFNKTRSGTFCVPAGSEWEDWRGPATTNKDEGTKPWTANNRDHQQGSWNHSPSCDQGSRSSSSWKGQDKWAWDQKDSAWRLEQHRHAGNSKESGSSWKGQEDKWTWDQKDHDGWRPEQQHAGNSNEWKNSWGYKSQNKAESRNNSW